MTKWTWKTHSCLRSVEPIPEKFGKCCREGISPLMWRIPILVWAVSIISWSVAFFWGPMEMFFLYMTHWGLLLIVVESVFGIVVATKKHTMGYLDATFGLPWYVKAYWVLYNVTIPVAFLITVFYWGILKTSSKIAKYAPNPVLDAMLHGGNSVAMFIELILSAHPSRLMHIFQPLLFALAYLLFTVAYYYAGGLDPKIAKYAPNPVLDAMLHGGNSVAMFIELILSAHPSRLMHIFQPLLFALAYLLFTVAYYYAGGLDPWGNPFIYPVIDWSQPKQTAVVVALTALFLALMHLLVVAVAAARDAISRRLRATAGIYNDGFGEEP